MSSTLLFSSARIGKRSHLQVGKLKIHFHARRLCSVLSPNVVTRKYIVVVKVDVLLGNPDIQHLASRVILPNVIYRPCLCFG